MQAVLIAIALIQTAIIIYLLVVTSFILDQRKQFSQRLGDLTVQSNGIAARASQDAKEAASAVMTTRSAEFRSQKERVEALVSRASRIMGEVQEEKVVLTKVIIEFTDLIRDFRRDLKEARDAQEKPEPGSYQARYNEEMNKAYEEGDRSK